MFDILDSPEIDVIKSSIDTISGLKIFLSILLEIVSFRNSPALLLGRIKIQSERFTLFFFNSKRIISRKLCMI